MLAEEKLREGNVEEALLQLKQAVRQDPANPEYRVFLFQLLAVLGQWESALNQLQVAGELDAGTLSMVHAYREAIQCEAFRSQVFAGERSPLIFGEPDQWLALVIEALQLTAKGQHLQAQQLRDQAFEAAPATAGSLRFGDDDQQTPQSFEWIADADSRLGPILEALVNGQYYWVPFHQIRQINVERPADLRDFVWTPVHFTWINGGQTVGMIPTRYPGSESSEDNSTRLARRTTWEAHEGDVYLGLGQRMLATDIGEYPLMDIREIDIDGGNQAGNGSSEN